MAEANLASARGQWVQQGLPPNPMIGYIGDEIGDEGSAGMHGIIFGQRFITAGKLRLNRQVAAEQLALMERQLQTQRLRVTGEIARRFYEVALVDRRLQTLEELTQLAHQTVQAIETLYRAQEAPLSNLLQAESEAALANLNLQQERIRKRAAWERLAAVVGVPELPIKPLEAELEGALISWDWSLAWGQVLEQSPEVKAAAAEVERARWALRAAMAQRIPDIDVETMLKHHNISGDNSVTISVTLPLPLFDRNQGAILAAQAELKAAEANLRRVQLELQGRLANAAEELLQAQCAVEKYRQEVLPRVRRSLELIQQGYQQGEVQFIDLLNAQQDFRKNELEYFAALERAFSAQSTLQSLLASNGLIASD